MHIFRNALQGYDFDIDLNSNEKMSLYVPYLQLIIPRRKGTALRLALLAVTCGALAGAWSLSRLSGAALLPARPALSFDHFKLNRSLKSYLDDIAVLIEPSSTVCSVKKKVDMVVLVTSSPTRFLQRQTIRDTWGKHVPTYFVLGLDGPSLEDLTTDNYLEAKQYGDTIIFKLQEHYQNLTLKTAAMVKWTVERCPTEVMMFKTDDDVLVNPWILKQLVREHSGKDLVGYRKLNNYLHRDEYNKWFIPRWLHRQDFVPEYLSGTGYLVNGRVLRHMLEAAYSAPVINLEDVYFTYIVAKLKLSLTLTHDHRLSPYKPWLPLACMYWGMASLHSLTPKEMLNIWPTIEKLGKSHEEGHHKCGYFVKNIWSEWFLY